MMLEKIEKNIASETVMKRAFINAGSY